MSEAHNRSQTSTGSDEYVMFVDPSTHKHHVQATPEPLPDPTNFRFEPAYSELTTMRNRCERIEQNIHYTAREIAKIENARKTSFKHKRRCLLNLVSALRLSRIEDPKIKKALENRLNYHGIHLDITHAVLENFNAAKREYDDIGDTTQLESYLQDYTLSLSIQQQQLAIAESTTVNNVRNLSHKDIEEQINSIADFSLVKIISETTDNQKLTVSIVTDDIHVIPAPGTEENATTLMNDNATDFVLKPITFDFTVDISGGVDFAVTESEKFKGFSDELIAHPHWLNNTSFCFGDFKSTVTEAAKNFDIITILSLFRTALGNYNPDDIAGINFTKWLGLEDVPGFCTDCESTDCSCIDSDVCSECGHNAEYCECCSTCFYHICQCCTICADSPCCC